MTSKIAFLKKSEPEKSELLGFLLRIIGGGLTVGVLIVLPSLKIVLAAL
jgi:hypothetical protein